MDKATDDTAFDLALGEYWNTDHCKQTAESVWKVACPELVISPDARLAVLDSVQMGAFDAYYALPDEDRPTSDLQDSSLAYELAVELDPMVRKADGAWFRELEANGGIMPPLRLLIPLYGFTDTEFITLCLIATRWLHDPQRTGRATRFFFQGDPSCKDEVVGWARARCAVSLAHCVSYLQMIMIHSREDLR